MAVMSFGKVTGQKRAEDARFGTGDAIAVELAPRSIRRLTGDHRGLRVTCTGAGLWITQDGDPFDYCLVSGEQLTISKPGLIVLQGMRAA